MKQLNEIQEKVYEAYPTYQQFMAAQDPKKILVNFSDIHEVADAISTRRLSIAEMIDIYGTDSFNPGVDYFAKWLSFFNKFTNISNTMPPDTIEWVAIHLCTKYCHFYFADLKVIFEHLLESKYGKFYGSIDAVRIMSGFLEYNEARNRIFNQVAKQREAEYQVWYKHRVVELREIIYQKIKSEDKYKNLTSDQQFDHMVRTADYWILEETKKLFPWLNK